MLLSCNLLSFYVKLLTVALMEHGGCSECSEIQVLSVLIFTAVLELRDIKKVTIQRGDLRRGSEPLMDSNAFEVRIVEIMDINISIYLKVK